MIENKYPNNCTICKIDLDPGDGFVFKEENDGPWKSVCQGIECIKRACPDQMTSYKQIMATKRKKERSFDKKAVERAKKVGLYDYQIEGVKWITSQNNCLLAFDMGLGKTPVTLISLEENKGTLVVAPSHLKLNWRDEAAKWRPDLKITVIKDGKMFKYPEPGEVVITTYGLLPFWLDLPERKRKNPNIFQEEKDCMENTILIFDEVQALKNSKSIKSKRSRELVKMASKTIGLTGTPIMNRELELWNIFRAIGIEKIVFNSFPKFLYLFGGRKGRFGYTFSGPKPEVPKILRKAMLRKTKEEVDIELPNKVYVEIPVELPSKIKKTMDNVWDVYKNSSYFSNDELPDFSDFSKEKELLAKSKIKALKQVIDDLEEKGIVPIVFSAHHAPVDEISKRKGWKTIKGVGMTPNQKHKIKNEFQKGKLKGLAATIKAAGTGLTLTHAHHVVFNDLDFVPANNVQAEDRAARIGQKANKVIIYHLVADHPLDRHIRRLILKKMALAHKALNIPNNISPNENETQEDFEKRVNDAKEKDLKMQQEAIVSCLTYWPKVKYTIEDERVEELLKISNILELEKNDARIVRLLKFIGMKGQKEARCLEAVLSPYEKKIEGGFKKILKEVDFPKT